MEIITYITHVYRQKSSVTDPHFYHLIAVLPTLAMVFEQVIYSSLYFPIYSTPASQFDFMKGIGMQDCGTAIAFTAFQTLEHREQCHVVSLDICRAFDSIWWAGLLKHLWSVALRSKAYGLLCPICVIGVCLWWLMVISSQWNFTTGVPQGGVWSSILLNLYI